MTAIPDEIVQFIPRCHISLNDGNIDINQFEQKLEKLIVSKLKTSWLPGTIEYTTEPLKRMANSKFDISYYQEQDRILFESGKINNNKAKTLRLEKM